MRLLALSVKSVAVIAEPIACQSGAITRFSLVHRYIAIGRTCTVVVVDTIVWWFIYFVDGIKRRYLWHRISPLI